MRTVEAVFTVSVRRNTKPKERRAQSDRRWVGGWGGPGERTSHLMSLSSPGFAGLWKGKINYSERGRQV